MTTGTKVFGECLLLTFQTFLLIVICILTTGVPMVHAINVAQGDPAPDFKAFTIDGKEVTLSDYRGNPVFIAFWSSWCSRCREEMEYLKELKKNYPTVNFLAINSESDELDLDAIQRMETVIRDWGIPFTVLVDDGLRIWDLYGIQALPTSLIVASDGTIFFIEPNFYFASATNFENALLELFDPKPKYSQKRSEAD